MRQSDRINLTETQGAMLAKTASSRESMLAVGIFDTELWRVIPRFASRARPLIIEANAIRDAIRLDPRRVSVRDLGRLDEIPGLLRSMQEVVNRDRIFNTVMTEGKNGILDSGLAGSGFTVVGPYMGLISSTSWSATAAGDTGVQINGSNGWKEAGATNTPHYSGTRKTCAWSSAASGIKALSAALTFTFTGAGTVKGCFIVFGSGALNTIDSTAANTKLVSAGVFAEGDKVVADTEALSVSYSLQF